MASIIKETPKKNAYHNAIKTKSEHDFSLKEKSASKKVILQSLLHPDYVLFDWEFFSNQLEFE